MVNNEVQYAIELPVRYEVGSGEPVTGEGRTLAIGSRAIRLAAGRNLQTGRKIQLWVSWPVPLPDGTELTLWIGGKITRSRLLETEVSVAPYDFKTRRRARVVEVPKPGPERPTLKRAVGA